jgi:uncharacterized damage-inducible protein DinB
VPPTDPRLNPYAHFLEGRDAFQVLEATPETLARLTRDLSADQLTTPPAPKKWSVRDILSHLADTEIVFAFRLRQTAAEPNHVIQPFDQDAWAAPFARLDARDALRAFAEVRRWNLLFIHAVPPAVLGNPVTHPERGVMTFQTILETMAGHDLNHVEQIERAARGSAG